MDTKALQLASRFALPPNSLGYCGKNTAPEKFKKCTITGVCEGVEEEIGKFIVLYPYLKTLSQITKLPAYSREVIEAYWFGNEQLRKVGLKHYNLLLENFKKQGVPSWLIDELKEKKPKKFIPNHLFQVLHVGVGRASDSVPYNLGSINNCMIRWGKVTKLYKGKLGITLNSLEQANGVHSLTFIREVMKFNKKFLGPVKVGDTVAVHWKQVVKILTTAEVRGLYLWTKKVLDSFQLTGKAQLPKP